MSIKHHAFSLIELLIVLAIILILIKVSYPVYLNHVAHAERNRAEVALLQLSAKLEAYDSDQGTYAGASLDNLGAAHLCDGLHYHLSLLALSSGDYLIAAVPDSVQAARDPLCETITVNSENQRTISGSGEVQACWM